MRIVVPLNEVGERPEQVSMREKSNGRIEIKVEGKMEMNEGYTGPMTEVSIVELSKSEAAKLAASLLAISK